MHQRLFGLPVLLLATGLLLRCGGSSGGGEYAAPPSPPTGTAPYPDGGDARRSGDEGRAGDQNQREPTPPSEPPAEPLDQGASNGGTSSPEEDPIDPLGSLLGDAVAAWTTPSGDTLATDWGSFMGADSSGGFGGFGVIGTGRGGAGSPLGGGFGTIGRGAGSGSGYGSGSLLSSGESESPIPEGTVARYPTVEAPPSVASGVEFVVMVSLSTAQITPEVSIESGQSTADGQIVMQLPEERTSWELDVVLSAPGFDFRDGVNTRSIVLPESGDSTPALFRLTALPPQDPNLERKLFATFWHQGGYLARVSRPIKVHAAGGQLARPAAASPSSVSGIQSAAEGAQTTGSLSQQFSTQASGRRADAAGLSQQQALAPGGAAVAAPPTQPARVPALIALDRLQPDLTLFLLRGLNPERPTEFEVVISSPHLQPTRTAYDRPADFEAWLEQQYAVLSSLSARGVTTGEAPAPRRVVARDRIEGFGDELYDRFVPEPVKDAFWTLSERLQDDFDVIQIYSDDPVFPWELVRPFSEDGLVLRDFLGLEFMIGRWHVAGGARQREQPPQALPVQGLAFWAPNYEGAMRLPGQQQELAHLASLEGFSQWPGRLDVIGRLFSTTEASIVHFSGHGIVTPGVTGLPESRIIFEDGELDVLAWRRIARRVRRLPETRPLFFFNACEVGRAEQVAGYVDGWAPAVLEAGASGYIGALWPIGDAGAASFSARFYSLMQDRIARGPVRVSELVRESRRLFLEDPDPTFLAYVYYGDPQLVLVSP